MIVIDIPDKCHFNHFKKKISQEFQIVFESTFPYSLFVFHEPLL